MQSQKAASVLVLGQYALLRECLAARLAELTTFDVTVHSGDLDALDEMLLSDPPDVLLVDFQGADAFFERIDELERAQPKTKVVILGLRDLDETTLRYIERGLAGAFISLESSLEDLCQAVHRVLDGEEVCSPQVAYALYTKLAELARDRRREDQAEAFVLTPRETEILRLIADGMSNPRIAAKLYLSVYTIKNHVHRILDKLGVTNRREAVALARDRQWLTPPKPTPQPAPRPSHPFGHPPYAQQRASVAAF